MGINESDRGQKVRVLHVINSLSGSGGAEQGLVREVTRFPDETEQLVVTLYDGGSLHDDLGRAGIEFYSLGLSNSHSAWNWPEGVRRLRRVISAFTPDAVQSSLFSANLVAEFATKPEGIPTLSTFTLSGDLALHRSLQPGADTWYAAVLRSIGARAARQDHVWFRALTSDALETNCYALGVDAGRGAVIPRGVPVGGLGESNASRAGLGLPESGALILNVGRQTAQKGHSHLLEAFAGVLRHRSAHLVILGREGDATPAIEQAIADLHLTENVTLIPYTDRVGDYLAAADLFVFPALMEGLGTAVLEAMASGVPVIAFDIPPVREVVGDGRFAELTPAGNTAALLSAVERFFEDPSAARTRAEKARQWAEEQYDVGRVAVRVYELLERLATGRGLSG